MKCTKCGNELVEGAKFCTRCGNKIVYSHVENNVQENKVEEKNQSEWKEDKGENGSDKKGKFTYFAVGNCDYRCCGSGNACKIMEKSGKKY